MSVFNSIKVSVIVVLLVAGLIVGLSVSGVDLVNPYTSQAKAENIRARTAHEQVMNQLAEEVETIQSRAKIAEIEGQSQASQAYVEGLPARQLAAYERRMRILEVVMAFGGICIIFIGTVFAVRNMPKPANAQPPSPLAARPDFTQQRANARQREILSRHIALHAPAATDPQVRMTREQYQNLPHAE